MSASRIPWRRTLVAVGAGVLAVGLSLVASPSVLAATPTADLAVSTGAAVMTPGLGPATYHFTVANDGPDASSSWTVTTLLPTIIAPGPTVSSGCAIDFRTVTCSGSGLASGASFNIDITVSALALGEADAAMRVSGAEDDPNWANNTATGSIGFYNPPDAPPPTAPTGDWGTSGSDTIAPGTNQSRTITFTCLSASGCDYAAGMALRAHNENGAGFIGGTNTVYVDGHGPVGTCRVTGTAVDCAVTASGHADQGDTIHTGPISYTVPADAAAATEIFSQSVIPTPGWAGDDETNNTFTIATPPVAGAPLANWGVAGGIGGAALLLAAAYAIRRRGTRTQPARTQRTRTQPVG